MSEEIRLATLDDVMLIYNWANDDEVRKNSFCSEKIEWESHKSWFKNKINSDDCDFYIFMHDGIPVGQVRIDYCGNKGIISYSIAKEYRGKHFADKMLKMAEQVVKETRLQIEYLQAEVKVDNYISQKKFENLDYTKSILFEKKMR